MGLWVCRWLDSHAIHAEEKRKLMVAATMFKGITRRIKQQYWELWIKDHETQQFIKGLDKRYDFPSIKRRFWEVLPLGVGKGG